LDGGFIPKIKEEKMKLDLQKLFLRADRAIQKLQTAEPKSKFVLVRSELIVNPVMDTNYTPSVQITLRVHYKEYDRAKYRTHEKSGGTGYLTNEAFLAWRAARETFLLAEQYVDIDIFLVD
jgi:hypothetical protein